MTALVGASILALAVLVLLWSPRLHVPPSGRGGLLDIFGIVSLISRMSVAFVVAVAMMCVLPIAVLGATYLRLGLRTLRSGTWTDSLRHTGHLSLGLAAITVTLALTVDPTPPWRPLAAITCAVLGAHGVLLATHRPGRDPGHVALIRFVGATLVILATLLIVSLGPAPSS